MFRINKLIDFMVLNILLFSSINVYSQREFYIHDRGMLHNTLYNEGIIGATPEPKGLRQAFLPMMQWPPKPEGANLVIDGVEYSGHNNTFGGGVWIAANPDSAQGLENRMIAICGGSGAYGRTEDPVGRWSFPISFRKIDNFPMLEDGTLNSNYDPDQAEQTIIAEWATNVGITVRRTTRQWSYPDFDDIIFYEYTFTYTGNTDGDPNTIETSEPLRDVLINFNYRMSPNMFAFKRYYLNGDEWEASWRDGETQMFLDHDYWLNFNMDLKSRQDPSLAAKPEEEMDKFKRWSETGEMGGGLLAPGAPGYAMLYYDTNHLAYIDPNDPEKNESETTSILVKDYTTGNYNRLDENHHMKQPYHYARLSPNIDGSRLNDPDYHVTLLWVKRFKLEQSIVLDPSWWMYQSYAHPRHPELWEGRTTIGDWYWQTTGITSAIVFGPYSLEIGDSLEYAYAEVIGYGGEGGKVVRGNQLTQAPAYNPIPSLNKQVADSAGNVITEHYLDDYGYPDHINSSVINVQQVAHKANEAYLSVDSASVPYPVWPENNPSPSAGGHYMIPAPFPAPNFTIKSTAEGDVLLNWSGDVENFKHPRLKGDHIVQYNIYRSVDGFGWRDGSDGSTRVWGGWPIATIPATGAKKYEFVDTDPTFVLGDKRYYAITSVDDLGNQSGKTNITSFTKSIGSVSKLDQVYVVPNPFNVESGFTGGADAENSIGFYGLPSRCTIRIFSFAGQLVAELEHDEPAYSRTWNMVTRNNQALASGVYYYVVTTPEGDQTGGKFVIIK